MALRSAANKRSLLRPLLGPLLYPVLELERAISSVDFSTFTDPKGTVVKKRGHGLLHDPWYNKGTSFPKAERDRLALRGMLPPRIMTVQQQVDRFMRDFRKIPDTPDKPLEQWRMLNRLHDRNETLYYNIIINNIKEFAPIIYTPTVGLVCQNFSGLYRRPRGMYFTAEDKGEMAAMVWNWPADEVDVIVMTDGSRILGLGDLGVQGIGVVIGKLDLYVAGAGLNPRKVLPMMFDVGTDNTRLLENDLYMGLSHPRLEGKEYEDLMDEFMEAVFARWPAVTVQFEDFQNKWALKLLQKYRHMYRMFNDDVQGTACVALAGVLGAVRSMGRKMEELPQHKFVVVGAGSAGMGVVDMLRSSMVKYLGDIKNVHAKAAANFWLIDKNGLLTLERPGLPPIYQEYARLPGEYGLREGASLLDVVKSVQPDFLIGLSGVGGLFSKEVLEAMSRKERPAIFPMSNPTAYAEATAEDVFQATQGRAIFASGSPFAPVQMGDKLCFTNQGNNMYIFPGLGLGVNLSGARVVSDGMLLAGAERLAKLVPEEDAAKGVLFPPIERIREISREIAVAVIQKAVEEGLATGYKKVDPEQLARMNVDELTAYVARKQWLPSYSPLIYKEPF